MSAVYNPEADVIEHIERLEREACRVRRRIELSKNEEDTRVLRRQLMELKEEITYLLARVP